MSVSYSTIGNWFAASETYQYTTTLDKHWFWGLHNAKTLRSI